MKSLVISAAVVSAVLFFAAPASAAAIAPIAMADSLTIQVAGGCGPNGWRGPWGHCRDTPYYGQMPNGTWKTMPRESDGCFPGWWRGPWGHCRHTPYHGRLPGGGWQ